jgi:hypothetical protein
MSMHVLVSRPLRMALAATAFAVVPLFAGPPWISFEYPANPFDQATRDALAIVHTYHHGIPMQFPVRAYADGVVNGVRQRVQLQVTATSRTGIWAIKGDLAKNGSWVIRTDMTDTETKVMASALMALSGGELVSVRVPTQVRNGWVVPLAVTQADVDALLALAQAATNVRVSARK